MIYFVELWNVKPAWQALSTEERADYMEKVGGAMQELSEQGVKVLSWSKNDDTTDRKSDYDYFAIWQFPDQKTADGFQQTVEGAGWYNYFEQVNLMGQENTAQEVIGHLIQL